MNAGVEIGNSEIEYIDSDNLTDIEDVDAIVKVSILDLLFQNVNWLMSYLYLLFHFHVLDTYSVEILHLMAIVLNFVRLPLFNLITI